MTVIIDRVKTYRFLFEELVKRDFKKRYKRTALGVFWSLLGPMLQLLVMALVFTQFFGKNQPHFIIYLFSGNLVFSYFKESTNGGMQALISNSGIILKVKAPKYIFLLSKNVSALINFALTLIIFFIFVADDGIAFTPRFILLLYPIMCLLLFNIGVGLILSALYVFFRDTQYIYDIFTLLLMYLSAIFYTIDSFPYAIQRLFLFNPVYSYIQYFRLVVIDGLVPSINVHGLCAFYALAAIVIHHYNASWWDEKKRKHFDEQRKNARKQAALKKIFGQKLGQKLYNAEQLLKTKGKRAVLRKIKYKIFDFTVFKLFYKFTRIDKKMLFFTSFVGKKYDDSTKVIYEKMIADERFKRYKFVWTFIEPKNFKIKGRAKKVKHGTLKHHYYLMKSRCIVTDMGINIARHKKDKKFYFNTWHGTPIKNLDGYVESKITADIMCAQGNFDAELIARAFKIQRNQMLVSGLPRNDILANYNVEMKKQILNKLNLPKEKKILLYCPTFRNYERIQNRTDFAFSLKIPINFKEWGNKIEKDYIILFRAHHAVAETLNFEFNKFIYDFSAYDSLNDLMIVSDILLSDYSSIYFDYAIMGKPMLCFA